MYYETLGSAILLAKTKADECFIEKAAYKHSIPINLRFIIALVPGVCDVGVLHNVCLVFHHIK